MAKISFNNKSFGYLMSMSHYSHDVSMAHYTNGMIRGAVLHHNVYIIVFYIIMRFLSKIFEFTIKINIYTIVDE